MTARIALENVTLRYRDRAVLDGFSLSVACGEIVALLGPSGAGKTSVLRCVLGLVAPSSGRILIEGTVASKAGRVVVPPEDRHLAVVFQDLALWPHLTVEGNLAFGLDAQGVPRPERDARIEAMLYRVGLLARRRSHPGDLSGGERQRVAIARALVLEPRAVLLDEPLVNLDVGLRRDLLALFLELFRERCSTVIYVTHDLRESAPLADRIAVIGSGRLIQDGTLEDLHARPKSDLVLDLVQDLDWRGRVTK